MARVKLGGSQRGIFQGCHLALSEEGEGEMAGMRVVPGSDI